MPTLPPIVRPPAPISCGESRPARVAVRVLALVVCACGWGTSADLRAQVVPADATATSLGDLSLEELMDIRIVTVSKTSERLSDAPGIVSVATRDEINRFGGTTLKDILERVPGLIGSSVYMTDRSTIAARGDQTSNSGSHVLLLLNGRPVRESLEGGITGETLEAFPVNIIEQIEVIKGPGSVLYGTNAFSGVINVRTRKAEENAFSVTGFGGGSGAHVARGELTLRSGDLGVVAAVNYFQKADWQLTYFAPTTTGAMSVDLNIPNEGSGAFVEVDYRGLILTAAHHDWKTAYFVPDYMEFFPAYGTNHVSKTFANVGYEKEVTDRWETSVNATYTRSQLELSSWPAIDRDSSETLAEVTNFITLSERSKLTVGGLYRYTEGLEVIVGPNFVDSDANRTSLEFYGQMDYAMTDDVKLLGGVQANKIEDLDWDIVPRAGVIWNPTPQMNVKALYSEAYRAPSINENSLQHPALMGNPDLAPEAVATIDLGITYQAEQGQLGLNFFQSEIDHIVYQDRTGPIPVYANSPDTVEIRGVELEGKYFASQSLFLTGSVLYQESNDGNGNEDVTPIANFGLKAGISYVTENGITLGVFDVHQGGLNRSYNTVLNPSPRSYHKVSLHAKVDLERFLGWRLGRASALILQIDNLLDREIWVPAWGLTPGQSIPYEAGRAVYLGLQVTF